jgi:hypothetical protein
MEGVCCLIPEGLILDNLLSQYAETNTKSMIPYPLQFFPPDNIPGGFFLYLCPWYMIHELQTQHGIFPGRVMAYGPASQVYTSFQIGISDYLKTPWDIYELWARVEHRLGRAEFDFSWGTVCFAESTVQLNAMDMNLTTGAMQLFRILVNNAGNVLSRRHLLTSIGLSNSGSRLVDVYVKTLRQVIGEIIGQRSGIIVARYGIGYSLCR